ncbi:hypothetical protein ACFULT_06465 [Rhodococcus sp. NPDC057297]|uniref:hypothetical protein n=1 Tax=Rhodococcus sp. NPDC057297 TaxID=3346090 RepID=UPI0036308960
MGRSQVAGLHAHVVLDARVATCAWGWNLRVHGPVETECAVRSGGVRLRGLQWARVLQYAQAL